MVKYFVGIDEVGRGPVAGPVTVCAVITKKDFNKKLLKGVADSKLLSEKKRHDWFEKAKILKKENKIDYKVAFVSNTVIDSIGISRATHLAVSRCLRDVGYKSHHIMLDGLLSAPVRFKSQETIIRGDQKEPIISLASVIAKVMRDKRMCVYAERFPKYGFEKHKGYGTKRHYKAIKKYGLSSLHRCSFLKNC